MKFDIKHDYIPFLRQEIVRTRQLYLQQQQSEYLTLKQKIINHEALYSVHKLSNLLEIQDPVLRVSKLMTFLEERWKNIQCTSLSYTALPTEPITQLCVAVALYLEEVKGSDLGGYYQYLIPSLIYFEDQTYLLNQVCDYGLEDIIIADDLKSIIPANIIRWIERGEEQLIRPYEPASQDHSSRLTENEKQRLIEHSIQSERFVEISNWLKLSSLHDYSVGGAFKRLSCQLKKGSSHGGKGTALNASQETIDGVEDFFIFWESVDEKKKITYLNYKSNSRTMKDILDVLSGKKDGCVYEISQDIDSILEQHREELFSSSISGNTEALWKQRQFLYDSLDKPETIGCDKYYSLSVKIINFYLANIEEIKLSEFCNAIKDFDKKTIVSIYCAAKHKIIYNFNDFIITLLQNSPQQIESLFAVLYLDIKKFHLEFSDLLPILPRELLLAAFHGLILQNLKAELYSQLISKIPKNKFVLVTQPSILVRVIKSSRDFNFVIKNLSSIQQKIICENYKYQLKHIIETVDDFIEIINPLNFNPDLREKICEDHKDHLLKIAKSTSDFGNMLPLFSHTQFLYCNRYCIQNNIWSTIVISAKDFSDLIQYISEERRDIILNNFIVKLQDLINSADDFNIILCFLSISQRLLVYQKLERHLLALVTCITDVLIIINYLAYKEKKSFLMLNLVKIFNFIKSGFELGLILEQFSLKQCSKICSVFFNHKKENIIASGEELGKLLELVGKDKFSTVYQHISKYITDILKTPDDFVNLIKVSRTQIEIVINIIDENVEKIIQVNPFFKISMLDNLSSPHSNRVKLYIDNKVDTFVRIYQALYSGQTSFFKSNFISKIKSLDRAEQLIEIIRHIQHNPTSRSAKAWELTSKRETAELRKDVVLFKEIYRYSFKNSSFFARSKIISGMTFFKYSDIEKHLPKQFINLNIIDLKQNTRRSKILNSL